MIVDSSVLIVASLFHLVTAVKVVVEVNLVVVVFDVDLIEEVV